jgi:prenyltransferase beta subunit
VALRVLALDALGERIDGSLLARLREHRPGGLVNETMWAVIALRAVGESPPAAFVRAILSAQAKSGAFPWLRGGKPDSNDTAAAIQALRAAGLGIGNAPIRRAVVALRAFQNGDGGFSLTKGRESDAQSTGWAIQGLISAGEKPGKAPFRFLSRLRRADGSYRYSVRYGATPVWVTAQVLPALTGQPFPLR